jgi:hypothetical protein
MIFSAVVVLVLWLLVSGVQATTLNFDDISAPGLGVSMPAGYGGLDWNNFYVCQYNAYGSGYPGIANGVVSYDNVAYVPQGQSGSFSAATPFTLNSGYFTSTSYDNNQLTVTAYNGATQVFSNSWTLNTEGPLLINFDWAGVTTVDFTNSGYGFVMDNLEINDPTPAVPELNPSILAALGFALTPLGCVIRRRLHA